MRRVHLIEIEDQPWCPAPVRDAMTDYLQLVLSKLHPYAVIAPRLRAALQRTGARRVIDLCSGGGGPWSRLAAELPEGVTVCLTDLFPNLPALERQRAVAGDVLEYERRAVDATAVPAELTGFRTLFTGFHHFPPAAAGRVLEDAVRGGEGIAVFELTQRRASVLLGMLLVPLLVLLLTPAVRPFRWSRLFWTYVLPVVPLAALFDGVVSCLRTYTPAELRELTAGLDGYAWEIGEEKVPGSAAPVTYLIGYPARREA